MLADRRFSLAEGLDEGFGLFDLAVEGGEEAGDAALFFDVAGDGDADFGELVVVEAEAVVGEALGIAVEEADRFGQLEEVAAEERVDSGEGLENDIGRADKAFERRETGDPLPHAHHVVGDVVLVGEKVLFRGEFGGDAAAVFFAVHHAVVHGDGEGGQSGFAGFLALRKEFAEGVDFEFGAGLLVGEKEVLHQRGFGL